MSLLETEFLHFMEKFDANPFQITIGDETHLIGQGQPAFSVTFHKVPSLTDLVTSTSLTLGEAYMNGEIEVEGDLYTALNLFLGQMGKFHTDTGKLKKLIFSSKSKANQKKEVCSHYDLGNEFYKLWLDETMSYSCGYFKQERAMTLYEAQCAKVDYILEKLCLKEGMTLCDIGCGWGFLLIRAARRYQVRGLGITLSEEQKKKFEERIREEGLEEYLKVELLDYRDLPKYVRSREKRGMSCARAAQLRLEEAAKAEAGVEAKAEAGAEAKTEAGAEAKAETNATEHAGVLSFGRFDRVVSVGMVEHVGRGNYEEFLDCAKQVLKPGGLFLLHFISALREYPGDAWMKKYIFPGGVVPSLREILQIAGDQDFYTLDVESLRRHYNKTLLCWNHNFQEHRAEIQRLFGEPFTRMWELYLCSCAATFQNGVIDLHQVLFSNGVNNEVPMVRWY